MGKYKYDSEKYIRAKRRVENLKNFYAHIAVYVVMNVLLFSFKVNIIDFFVEHGVNDQGFLNWVEWNIVFIPIIWGVVLLLIGLFYFKMKPVFFRNWEERQIRKYMEK
ncbi:2TM domain-containing protein [Arenibacter sp. F26102]|uniref:2TM domain-containing protein n=1 Tax=Arenibacter sp. F26102 TaxID=2926416 RepID=UPI001FF4532D|nr:2TM domain-containing protein [Arenibacter sp. F26102]MCK0146979.1 2TM domain-containing protein [Arenibacter sp. F26102]